MPRSRYRLTPALQEKIVSYLRAGGSLHAAAEAAGLPRQVFERWLERGRRPHAPPAYRDFAQTVMEAHAQARLHVEVTTMNDKPLDWLKAGPGKDSAAKGRAALDRQRDGERLLVELFTLLGQCADHLAPYPDARAALSAWLVETAALRSKKKSPQWHDLSRIDTSTTS